MRHTRQGPPGTHQTRAQSCWVGSRGALQAAGGESDVCGVDGELKGDAPCGSSMPWPWVMAEVLPFNSMVSISVGTNRLQTAGHRGRDDMCDVNGP